MPVTRSADAPTWDLPGTRFTGLVSPSRGASADTAVWRVTLEPGTQSATHQVTRSEVFVPLTGTGQVRIGDTVAEFGVGDAFVVPADTEFSVGNPGAEPFEAVVCLPVGAQASFTGGTPFTPEWAS